MPPRESVHRAAFGILEKAKARGAPPDHHVAKEIIELTARSRFSEPDGVFHPSKVTIAGIVRAAKLLRRSEWAKLEKFPDVREATLRWLNEAEALDSYHLHYQSILQESDPTLYKHFILDVALYVWNDDCASLMSRVTQHCQNGGRLVGNNGTPLASPPTEARPRTAGSSPNTPMSQPPDTIRGPADASTPEVLLPPIDPPSLSHSSRFPPALPPLDQLSLSATYALGGPMRKRQRVVGRREEAEEEGGTSAARDTPVLETHPSREQPGEPPDLRSAVSSQAPPSLNQRPPVRTDPQSPHSAQVGMPTTWPLGTRGTSLALQPAPGPVPGAQGGNTARTGDGPPDPHEAARTSSYKRQRQPWEVLVGFTNITIEKAQRLFGDLGGILDAMLSTEYLMNHIPVSTGTRVLVYGDYTVEILVNFSRREDPGVLDTTTGIPEALSRFGRASVEMQQVRQMRIRVPLGNEVEAERLVRHLAS